MNREELLKIYTETADAFDKQEIREEKRLLLLSVLRLLCFAGGIAFTVFLFLRYEPVYGVLAAFATLFLFLFLLKLYSDHNEKKEFAANLAKINRDEARALDGDFLAFNPGDNYTDPAHDFSYDVDLFGGNSLFRYLNRTVTGYGRDIFAGWLSDPYSLTADLPVRQEIIRELSLKRKWRHEFLAAGMKVPLEKSHINSLAAWLDEKSFVESSRVRKALIFLLPAIALGSLLLLITGIIHYSFFILVLLLNLGYVSAGLKSVNRIHTAVSGKYGYLSSMTGLLGIIAGEKFASGHLNTMKQQIAGEGTSAATAVRKLGRLIQSFDSRMNLLVGVGLNALLLWDYHCVRRLEKWKSAYRDQFPNWLSILGEADAYTSLGNYAFNNDDFVYPELSTNKKVFSAIMLGHPLIPQDRRICNDFVLEKRGSICIITGANMAGKSTFLRTVAVNYILAMTGAPVCAGSLEFTPVKLFTSMRTTDSLAGNESYFYAELKRLRTLEQKIAGGEPVLFILDEILKGTNSADKTLGSGLFIKKLVSKGGTGLIATHDTSLGELENEYQENIFNMCFEIEIEGQTVAFDYKLRKGITQKMNAVLLMRQMGIL